jgi:DNA transposition AAA+ family ATPase
MIEVEIPKKLQYFTKQTLRSALGILEIDPTTGLHLKEFDRVRVVQSEDGRAVVYLGAGSLLGVGTLASKFLQPGAAPWLDEVTSSPPNAASSVD